MQEGGPVKDRLVLRFVWVRCFKRFKRFEKRFEKSSPPPVTPEPNGEVDVLFD